MRPPRPEWMRRNERPELPPLELRRAAPGERAFGYELRLVEAGAFSKAVQIFYGFGRAYRASVDRLAQRQMERLTRALASCPTAHTRAGVARLHLMVAAELRAHGNGYRAQGSAVFFGHQHSIDEQGQRSYLRKFNELGEHAQGGFAKRLGVSVRTIYRWWRILVGALVWDGCRPPRHAPDALLNRKGTQVYVQRWLVDGTPAVVANRLPILRPHVVRRPETSALAPSWMRTQLTEAFAFLDGNDVADDIPY